MSENERLTKFRKAGNVVAGGIPPSASRMMAAAEELITITPADLERVEKTWNEGECHCTRCIPQLLIDALRSVGFIVNFIQIDDSGNG